jgi:rhodanese-related sulfurtransferase
MNNGAGRTGKVNPPHYILTILIEEKVSLKPKTTTKKNSSKLWIWIGLGLTVVIIAVAVIAGLPGVKAQTLPAEVSVSTAAELRDSGAFILDVREPSEWDEIHVPGSTLIPLGQLESSLNQVPKDQKVVVICRSGNRSQTGRDILTSAGFENVTSVSGGIRAWQSAGYPTVSGP